MKTKLVGFGMYHDSDAGSLNWRNTKISFYETFGAAPLNWFKQKWEEETLVFGLWCAYKEIYMFPPPWNMRIEIWDQCLSWPADQV